VWLRPKEVKVSSVHQKFLEDIKDAIEQNMDNDQFSVEDLGGFLAMSRSQVHRKLKALTDQSATRFIRNYRLHRAAELLKKESGNVTEIAYRVGFSSQTYFSKCFQELFDCTPSEYKSKVT
jgi:AraC-like DNA-binding protein